MPRKREVKKRGVLPDPKYHDALIAKFINGIAPKAGGLYPCLYYNSKEAQLRSSESCPCSLDQWH